MAQVGKAEVTMDINSVKEKIKAGTWKNEVPPELKKFDKVVKKTVEAPKKQSLKDKLIRKKR